MLTSLFLLAASQGGAAPVTPKPAAKAAPIELYRKYVSGEKLSYAVKAAYVEEERAGEQITFFPSDVEQGYNFTIDVLKLKNDGFAELRYKRPFARVTIGDTVERGPVSRKIPLNWNLRMTASPLNETTDVIDETPKKKGASAAWLRSTRPQADGAIVAILGQVLGEIQQLSFFIGSFDSSLDLAPKLPVEAISPGDTWKRTVGFAPQTLKGEAKKQANQRLDYAYTYVGIVARGKTKVHRVVSTLSLKTDVAEFGRQLVGERADVITKVPVTLEAQIEYDLDLKTRHTIRAVATSRNTMQLFVKGYTAPYQESRAKGTTTLSLLSRTVGPVKKPKPARR